VTYFHIHSTLIIYWVVDQKAYAFPAPSAARSAEEVTL